jgi:hypothetical protein
MSRDFFEPSPEEQIIVLVDSRTLRQAEHLIESCEHCHEDEAQIPFDWILDRVLGSDSTITDYILEAPAKLTELPARDSRKDTDRTRMIRLIT